MGAAAIFNAAITVMENAPALEGSRREALELAKRLWDLVSAEVEPEDEQLRRYTAAFEAARSSLANPSE